MLTRIHIDNYKCLTNFDLRLDNLTLLAGANGCGKSAVFEVVGKLRDFACDWSVDKLFFADDLTRWTMKRKQRFELEFSTGGGVFAYRLVIEHKPGEKGAEVASERLAHDGKTVLSSSDRKPNSTATTTAKNMLMPLAGTVRHWRRKPMSALIRVCTDFATSYRVFRHCHWHRARLRVVPGVNPTC